MPPGPMPPGPMPPGPMPPGERAARRRGRRHHRALPLCPHCHLAPPTPALSPHPPSPSHPHSRDLRLCTLPLLCSPSPSSPPRVASGQPPPSGMSSAALNAAAAPPLSGRRRKTCRRRCALRCPARARLLSTRCLAPSTPALSSSASGSAVLGSLPRLTALGQVEEDARAEEQEAVAEEQAAACLLSASSRIT